MKFYKIVETDNFGRDWPDETFVNIPLTTEEKAKKIADVINSVFCPNDNSSRYWKVVDEFYIPQPGFEE